jgi:hypothetical protein
MMETNVAKNSVLDIVEDPSAWTEWLPLSAIKSGGTFHPDEKVSGIYQISDIKTTDIVDADIGYIGKASNVEGRVWNVNSGVRNVQSSNHSCGKWLHKQGHTVDTVFCRMLFIAKEDITKAEAYLQDKMQKQFGYRFKWMEAGENKLGRDFQLREQINELSITSIVEDVLPMIERKIGRELLIALINKEISIKANKD